MLGREELEYRIITTEDLYEKKVYLKNQADNVMDAMEARIKELEKLLEDCTLMTNEELIKNLARTCREYTQYNLNLQHNIDAQNARIKELEAVISKMETTTPKWISVKDRLPEEDEFVLAMRPKAPKYKIDVVSWSSHYYSNDVTHWMPLPQPPTTQEK